MTVFMLDTCIWRDFYEDRKSMGGDPIGKHASSLLLKIISNRDTIIYSEVIVAELLKDYSNEEVSELLSFLSATGIAERVDITKEERDEAKALCRERKVSFADCFIAIHARNHKAVLVTRDKHFSLLADIIKPVRPEEVSRTSSQGQPGAPC